MTMLADINWNEVLHTVQSASIWQWLGTAAVLLGGVVVGRLAMSIVLGLAKRLAGGEKHPVVGIALRSAAVPALLLCVAGGLYWANVILLGWRPQAIELFEFINNLCLTIVSFAVAWFLYRLMHVIEYFLHLRAQQAGKEMQVQFVAMVRKFLQIVILVLTFLLVAQNVFHWRIDALLAGLGIGGLAIALAAQQTLSNLFGSITIFADRPFRIHDTVRVRNYYGVVEDVGFRSTRVRTAEGVLVTMPNSIVANEFLENLGYRPGQRRDINLTLKLQTSPQNVQRAVEIARGLLEQRKEHLRARPPWGVYINDSKPGALNLLVQYWHNTQDLWAFQRFNHELFVELLAKLTEEGIELT